MSETLQGRNQRVGGSLPGPRRPIRSRVRHESLAARVSWCLTTSSCSVLSQPGDIRVKQCLFHNYHVSIRAASLSGTCTVTLQL